MGWFSKPKQHTPYEAPDNLKSQQKLSVIDAISEGPIEGPVGDLESIYINETPAIDTNGNSNVNGLTVMYNPGTQDQPVLEGFEESGSETVVNAEVNFDTPITRTITSANVDRLRVTFGVAGLVHANDQGDRNATEVTLLIQLQRQGYWENEKEITIRGKTTSQFLASVLIDDLPPRPFGLRLLRTTPDSNSDMLQNKTVWSSYSEIINIRQRYPNTALVGILVNSDQFGSQQVRRNYLVRGRILQVPDNYDPLARTYSGLWKGAFKVAWSNNPAWVLYDLLTHPRYGLGKRIGAAEVDKWALYGMAQYCDHSVPDGYGGSEPRMTCNAYLTEQRKAYDVISDMCSIMRCMPVWNGQVLTFVQDRPSDAVWLYTNANVVEGRFVYTFSALKTRHTAAEVRFIDPDNGWKVSTEYVSDDGLIARYGLNVLKMEAFGCTSRGQAHRMGLWALVTEKLETQTVAFSIGMEGIRHIPGDVFEVCDNDYAGLTLGGRLLEVGTDRQTVTLDRAVTLPSRDRASLILATTEGESLSVKILAQPAPDVLEVQTLPQEVATLSVWILRLPQLQRRLFRCLEIAENDDGSYAVTALEHVPEKGALVDKGASFDPKPPTSNTITPPAVQHLTVEVEAVGGQYQARVRWDTPQVVKGVSFLLQLKVQDETQECVAGTYRTSESLYVIGNLTLGAYCLLVRAVNSFGHQGDPASVNFTIVAPEPPVFVTITPGYFQFTATPRQRVYNADTQFEFYLSAERLTNLEQVNNRAGYLGRGHFWVVSGSDILPGHNYYLYVRSVNVVGKSPFFEAIGYASNDAAGYLEFFSGQISDSHLASALLGKIALSEHNASQIEEINATWKDTQGKLNSLWGVKLQQLQDGRYYIAGLGVGIENTPEGIQSQVLLVGDRIAMIDPENGNTTPMFVAQNEQIWMNEVFLKYLNAATIRASTITSQGDPPTFSLTPEGFLTARNADITGNINATSGTFSRVVIDETCDVKEIRAEVIKGDIVKAFIVATDNDFFSAPAPFARMLNILPYTVTGSSSSRDHGHDGMTSHSRGGRQVDISINGNRKTLVYQLGDGSSTGWHLEEIPANTSVTVQVWGYAMGGNTTREIPVELAGLLFKS